MFNPFRKLFARKPPAPRNQMPELIFNPQPDPDLPEWKQRINNINARCEKAKQDFHAPPRHQPMIQLSEDNVQ
jgi:hypothetical protein